MNNIYYSGSSSILANIVNAVAQRLMVLQCSQGRRYPSHFVLRMFQYAAERGHLGAMTCLGELLLLEGACRTDKRSGLEYLRRAAKAGFGRAQYQMGIAYVEGCQVVEKDSQIAAHWLVLASENGCQDAADRLAEQQSQAIKADENVSQETVTLDMLSSAKPQFETNNKSIKPVLESEPA